MQLHLLFFLCFNVFFAPLHAGVSSNPGAVEIENGTGQLGQELGLQEGVRLGALLIEDLNYLFQGGVKPRTWSGNSIFVLSLNLDTAKLDWWESGKFGIEYFQLNGRPTNREAGTIQGYNSLTGTPPLDRSQLYQLWYRHEFFNQKLIIRIGKQIPNYDFNNVLKPLKVEDKNLAIAATSGLTYTPIYVNGTLLGVLPGYYNSVYGILFTLAPSEDFYINYALYDGNMARGKQTGLRGPEFNSYRFQIAELGYAWGLDSFPGNIGIGVWNQSGKLSSKHITEHGADGLYLFGTQRLWRARPQEDNSGIIGLIQAGINNSKTLPITSYAGLAFTFLGLVPNRPDDTFGMGLAFAKLNKREFKRKNELMLQGFYEANLYKSIYFVSSFTYIPNPGASPHLRPATAATARIIALF